MVEFPPLPFPLVLMHSDSFIAPMADVSQLPQAVRGVGIGDRSAYGLCLNNIAYLSGAFRSCQFCLFRHFLGLQILYVQVLL